MYALFVDTEKSEILGKTGAAGMDMASNRAGSFPNLLVFQTPKHSGLNHRIQNVTS